jgi:hypothetical protein
MKSRRHNRSTKRSRWAWNNSPAGLRNRKAKADARTEALIASLPPVDPGPAPLSVWQSVVVYGSHGQVMHTLRSYVPALSSGERCDQHPAEIDGKRCEEMLSATEIGRQVAAWICKRPSVAIQAQVRAEAVAGAWETLAAC